jgi:endonuclease G
MYQLVLAVSLFGSSPAPDTTEPATPIIGGTVVTSGNWKDTVAVIGAQGTCSGTLVAPDVVITAGHCAEINPTQIKLDTIDLNGAGGITATVQSITAYPNWENTYDISVIKLAAPVTGVPPRKVAAGCTFATGWSTGTSVHLVGYGAIDLQAEGDNSKLYEVSVPLTDPTCAGGNGCQTAVSPNGEFTAGGGGRDSCNGDSGGPVYLDTPRGPILVGAVSRATDSATNPCGDGGIYVRIDKVTQWIETTTGRTLAKDDCLATPPSDPTNPDGPMTGDPMNPGGGTPDDGVDEITGGCSAGGSSGGLAGLALALGAVLLRRRR